MASIPSSDGNICCIPTVSPPSTQDLASSSTLCPPTGQRHLLEHSGVPPSPEQFQELLSAGVWGPSGVCTCQSVLEGMTFQDRSQKGLKEEKEDSRTKGTKEPKDSSKTPNASNPSSRSMHPVGSKPKPMALAFSSFGPKRWRTALGWAV